MSMPRPERPIDPAAGPVQAFAAELRLVREKAGSPKYLQMARISGRSRTALSEAAGGDHLPTWETVYAFLYACGEPPEPWEARWEQVRAQLDPSAAPPGAVPCATNPADTDTATATSTTVTAIDDESQDEEQDGDAIPAAPPELSNRRHHRVRNAVLVVAGLAALSAVLVSLVPAIRHPHGVATTASASRPPLSKPVVVVVENKIATGAAGFVEDSTPAYLSTRPIPFCARIGCQVPATTMWSGAVVQVLCQRQGATMTNADTTTAGIEHNPHAATSSLWYLATLPTGATGYIAEIYLAPASRGGLNLPPSPPT
jgi:hypothetical protein